MDIKLSPSTRSKQLLAQLNNHEMTLDEFLVECAYWAVSEGFDEIKPRSIPSKPDSVLRFENNADKDTDWNKIYNDHPEVKAYYEIRNQNQHYNEGVINWLEELLRIVPEGDFITTAKIKAKLQTFKPDETQINKIKETFNAREA